MKLDMERNGILLTPENEMEETYLECILGLGRDGGVAQAKRVNAHGLSCWAYLEISRSSVQVPSIKSKEGDD